MYVSIFIFDPIDSNIRPSEAKNWNCRCQTSFVMDGSLAPTLSYILPFSPALHSRRKMEASILCHTYFCTQIILFLGVKKRNKENWDEENKVQMCKKNWKCIKRSVFSRKTKIYVTKQLLFVVVLLVVGIWQDKFGRKTFEQIHVREKVFQV